MSQKPKTAVWVTIVGILITVITLLLTSGMEIGSFQSKITHLEARASVLENRVERKLDQDQFYRQNLEIKDDLKTIKQDIKSLLRRAQ